MSGFSVNTNEHLIRSNIWTPQIKEQFQDELFATKYVDMVTDFPDGDTWNMPSIGQMEVRNYAEGQAVQYTAMDTGNFTLTITEYKTSATFVTNKMKQDSFYMGRLVSSFPQRQSRALMKSFELTSLTSVLGRKSHPTRTRSTVLITVWWRPVASKASVRLM
jgi:hypothetical protein